MIREPLTLVDFGGKANEPARRQMGLVVTVLQQTAQKEPWLVRVSGPMGAGKTSLCQYTANQAGVELVTIDVTDFVLFGDVKERFDAIRAKDQPVLVVIENGVRLNEPGMEAIETALVAEVSRGIENCNLVIVLTAVDADIMPQALCSRFGIYVTVHPRTAEELQAV